jgi:hypothetical protein
MDRGELFKIDISIRPVKGGGFLICKELPHAGYATEMLVAFSNLRDLMQHLDWHASAPDPRQAGQPQDVLHIKAKAPVEWTP